MAEPAARLAGQRFDVAVVGAGPQRPGRRGVPGPGRPAHGRGRAPRDRRRRVHDRGVRPGLSRLAGRLRAQPPAAGRVAGLRAPRPWARGARGGADPQRLSRRRPPDAPRRRPRDGARARALRPRATPRPTPVSGPSWWRSPTCSGRGSTARRPGRRAGWVATRCAQSAAASAPRAATGSPRRSSSRPPPATTSNSGFAPSASAQRSAGTRSRTRSPAPRRPGPPTRCCTSTPPPRWAGRRGASSAEAWASSPRCSPTPRRRRGR